MNNITLPRAVVEQALKALEEADLLMEHRQNIELRRSALVALRAELEQPQGEQEPVGKLISDPYEGHIFIPYGDRWPFNEDLYTHPQQREALTDEEIQALQGTINWYEVGCATAYGRAIEAAHGIGSKV